MRTRRQRLIGWRVLVAVLIFYVAVSFGSFWLFTISGWVEPDPSAPEWARIIALALIVLGGLVWYALLKRAERRVRAGYCPNCNYDLRHASSLRRAARLCWESGGEPPAGRRCRAQRVQGSIPRWALSPAADGRTRRPRDPHLRTEPAGAPRVARRGVFTRSETTGKLDCVEVIPVSRCPLRMESGSSVPRSSSSLGL